MIINWKYDPKLKSSSAEKKSSSEKEDGNYPDSKKGSGVEVAASSSLLHSTETRIQHCSNKHTVLRKMCFMSNFQVHGNCTGMQHTGIIK